MPENLRDASFGATQLAKWFCALWLIFESRELTAEEHENFKIQILHRNSTFLIKKKTLFVIQLLESDAKWFCALWLIFESRELTGEEHEKTLDFVHNCDSVGVVEM